MYKDPISIFNYSGGINSLCKKSLSQKKSKLRFQHSTDYLFTWFYNVTDTD